MEQQNPHTNLGNSNNNLFESFSSRQGHQGPFDFTGLPDHYTDPSLEEQSLGEFEDQLSGILRMTETSLPSTRRAIDSVNDHRAVGTVSHQGTVESTSSRETQQSNSDHLDSLMKYTRTFPLEKIYENGH